MLVRFRSTATDSITMFDSSAVPLLKMMGVTGNVPGALNAEDVPKALQSLRNALGNVMPPAKPRNDGDEDDKDEERAVGLPTRAVPLVNLLERAAAAHAEVMWEKQ